VALQRIATTGDVPEGQVRVFTAGNLSVALCNVGGTFYAVDNLCTHDNGPLGEGRLSGETVECPRHGARFDVKSGAVRALPAVRPIKTYPVEIQGEEVLIDA
jgi:3-phenylpropionate/trans-cinnamate dioxygenase ferredoxin subunit